MQNLPEQIFHSAKPQVTKKIVQNSMHSLDKYQRPLWQETSTKGLYPSHMQKPECNIWSVNFIFLRLRSIAPRQYY